MAYSVLLVDDEPNFCTSLKSLLEADGYQVTVSNTGRESLFHLESALFDAVLLDLGLPDMSGISLVDTLRTKYPDTVVIILTGCATVDNAVEALRGGVYDYLKKPFDPKQLVNVLARGIEYKALKKKLANSEKRFRQLASATWEGIIIYDKGVLLQANSQLYKMFGYTEEELVGTQIFDILLDRSTIKAMNLQSDPETIGPFEATAIKKDGSRFPVEIRVKRIDYSGRSAEVAAIRDVTSNRIFLEKQLALRQKLADARRMETLGLMAASVAHDLNNIMAGIITYPELLLLDLPKNFKYRKEIEMIRDAGKRAAAVVNDLLTLSRGAGSNREVKNLNDLIRSYINSVECRELYSRYPGITITTSTDPELADISCSTVHVTKSLVNLVNNAAEAAKEGGSITIKTKHRSLTESLCRYETIEPGEYALLEVHDNGPGIADSDLPHIFDPFYSKKILGRSGTGLGLTVVWNTVHDHGGFLDVLSSDKGTSFILYFPVTEEDQPANGRLVSSLLSCQGQGERILVVDDQKSQREIARRLLTRLGYQVHTVASGEEAVEFIKQHQIDLVLLDMVMEPGINGCQTYERIIEHRPNQKAIITGYSSSDDIEMARKLGIHRFLRKPYTLNDLGQALRLEIS